MADLNCCTCEVPFERKFSRLQRKSSKILADSKTLNHVFGRNIGGYLCYSCVSYLNSATTVIKALLATSRKLDNFSKAADLIQQSQYKKAFKLLINQSSAAKRALLEITTDLIKKELFHSTKARNPSIIETLSKKSPSGTLNISGGTMSSKKVYKYMSYFQWKGKLHWVSLMCIIFQQDTRSQQPLRW
jgi:hypothetical protein